MTIFSDAFADIAAIACEIEGISAMFCGTSINIIFSDEGGVFQGVETQQPLAEALTSDLEGVVHGDVLTVNDTEYYVTGIEKRSAGYTILQLSRQP